MNRLSQTAMFLMLLPAGAAPGNPEALPAADSALSKTAAKAKTKEILETYIRKLTGRLGFHRHGSLGDRARDH